MDNISTVELLGYRSELMEDLSIESEAELDVVMDAKITLNESEDKEALADSISTKISNIAINFLARREHSKLELKRKLCAKGFGVDDVIRVINELAEQGLQSDARFVESYVNIRCGRGFGPVRIKMELHGRGIDQELGKSFCNEHDLIWFELAKTVCHKKFGDKIPDGSQERAQQMKYLYYKGFTSDHIREILR